MNKILITQSNYIPWKGYFDSINLVDELILLDDVQFTKRDWRNRNKIKTPDGLKWLTIPVEVKGKYHQKINETKISDQKWNISHWQTIKNNYKNSKNFKEFSDFFEELYIKCDKKYLSEINFYFISAICELIEINTKITFSSSFELIGGKTDRLVDLCKKTNSNNYYTGPKAKDYIENEKFEMEGIKVNYLDYSSYIEYPQINGVFSHEVSIIDLLFNVGKDYKLFLKTFN